MTDMKPRWSTKKQMLGMEPRWSTIRPKDTDMKPRWTEAHAGIAKDARLVLQTPTLDIYSLPDGNSSSSSYALVQELPNDGREYNYTRVNIFEDGRIVPVDDDVTVTPYDLCLIHEYLANQP